jgi:acyl-CoA synthetase (AMP-forming)/AMP-acid ligase II
MTPRSDFGAAFRWLESPSTGRGMRFALKHDEWDFRSYAELSGICWGMARRLAAAGVRPGDSVLLMMPTSPLLVASFFGARLAGAVPSVLAPPLPFANRRDHVENFARVAASVPARAVVTVPAIAPDLAEAARARGCAVLAEEPDASGVAGADRAAFQRSPRDTAIIQFSSGTTGTPRGVRISQGALDANVDALLKWLDYTGTDSLAGWLPLYHDMGLIGCMMTPMAMSSDMWLMSPEQFIRSPARWLRLFGTGEAKATATPVFGLAHVVRRVRPRELEGLDFSGWRTLIIGAEPIEPAVVNAFVDLLKPFGFDPRSVLPAYGMAEATLAVTGASRATEMRTVTVRPSTLRLGRPVELDSTAEGRPLAGCGRPLPGMGVTVVDERGEPVPSGVVGELVVRGDSLADGYIGGAERGFDGVLPTGDIGFVLDDELFVVGRAGDSIKQLGRWVFAEEIHRIAARVSPRPQQTVGLLGSFAGANTAAVVIEGSAAGAGALIGDAVANAAPNLRVLVLSAPVGFIARTTSGKPRRRLIWEKVAGDGHGGANVVWDSVTDREVLS